MYFNSVYQHYLWIVKRLLFFYHHDDFVFEGIAQYRAGCGMDGQGSIPGMGRSFSFL
jgi:hypothetical protein